MRHQNHRRSLPRAGHDAERGFATAEFAVAMPAVVLVLAALVGVLQALVVHHQALHGAGVGARIAARGESEAAIRSAVGRVVPGAATSISHEGPNLVTVQVHPRMPAVLAWALPDLSADATALREDTFTDDEAES